MSDTIERKPNLLSQEAPEARVEHGTEEPARRREVPAPQERQQPRAPVAMPTHTPAPQAIAAADPVLKSVEDILADGLMDLYATFPEDRKATFRQKGEEIARKIRDLIVRGKDKALDVLRLIRTWLHTIPGVNTLFLEQEAKIKTDRILAYGEEYRAKTV